MTRRMLWALGLTLVLAAPGLAWAGEVRLTIKDGRVALVARDATLREILVEWSASLARASSTAIACPARASTWNSRTSRKTRR